MNRWLCLSLLLLISAILVFGSNLHNDYDDDDVDDLLLNQTSNATLIFIKPLVNLTIDPANRKIVKLICEVQNLALNNHTGKVTFNWRKNLGSIDDDKRISIKTTKEKDHRYRSVLRIVNVELLDRGFYFCSATNGVDKIRSEALLEIVNDGGGRFDNTAMTLLSRGGETTTSGVAASEPIFVPDLNHMPEKHELEQAIKSGRITKTFHVTSTGRLSDDDDDDDKAKPTGRSYNVTQPFCEMYQGKTCGKYLDRKYVFIQPPFTQMDIELKLSNAFFVISQSNDISSSCNKFAHPSLCFSAFPLCVDPRQINTYQKNKMVHFANAKAESDFKSVRNELGASLKRICKDDCLLLETELCSKEYGIAKKHQIIRQTLELEECEFIPEDNSRDCLRLGVDDKSVNKDDNCFWDNGELYRGVQNVSETGHSCLRWAHQFYIHLSEYPELTGHNYCRNPGGVESQPFCYVNQNKRELCNITKCAYVVGMYIGGAFVAVCLFAVIIVGICCCRKKNKSARNLQNMNGPLADKNIYKNPGPNSPMELNNLLPPNIPPQRNHHHSSKNWYQNVPQYTYKEVTFIQELGEGAFGKVYKGELKTKNGKIFVAVKSLKENASAKTQADFQREIELISELKHPNIICLMGVVIKQEPMCMFFEYMSEGDLHEFLIGNSPSEGNSLTQNQFLHIAIQIAQGMEYLSENHYVHRDLAARNCLVSKDLVVKISDFGLSRDMYSCDYYRVQSKSLLPVRWMPPESILYGKFTTESDVWSYGVVLWEIYSYGLQPYYGYNNQEVINMIRSRKLLPCPDACPGYCYALMVECWAELPTRRPSFAEISHRLRVWKHNGTSNGAYFKTTPPDQRIAGAQTSTAMAVDTVTPLVGNGGGDTWERGLGTNRSARLNESQSSLTSRTSSLGNKTQSTSLSNEQHNSRHRKSHKMQQQDSLDRCVKNTVVSSNGDNFEIKITN